MAFALYKCFILISFCFLVIQQVYFLRITNLGTRSFVKILNRLTSLLVMLEKVLCLDFIKIRVLVEK